MNRWNKYKRINNKRYVMSFLRILLDGQTLWFIVTKCADCLSINVFYFYYVDGSLFGVWQPPLAMYVPMSEVRIPPVQHRLWDGLSGANKLSTGHRAWLRRQILDGITVTSKWTRWRIKSPASRLFIQRFIQGTYQSNIKTPLHWPLWGEVTGDRWIPRTKGQ